MQTVRSFHVFALVAAYTLTGAVALALHIATWLHVMVALVLAIPFIWLTVTDLARLTIPDWASVSVAVTGIVYQLQREPSALLVIIPVAAGLFILLWLAGEIYWRTTNSEALGIGDTKLIAAGTICVGVEHIWLVILTASVGGIIAIILAHVRRGLDRSGVPFGPFLAYAIFVTFLVTGSP
jgi:prepilin signal peptidase PulO-like enzyme (type II secretory pathway)